MCDDDFAVLYFLYCIMCCTGCVDYTRRRRPMSCASTAYLHDISFYSIYYKSNNNNNNNNNNDDDNNNNNYYYYY